MELGARSSLPLVTMLPNGSEAESGGPKREAASSMAGYGKWFADRRVSAAAINAETRNCEHSAQRLHVGPPVFLFFLFTEFVCFDLSDTFSQRLRSDHS